MFAFPVRKRYGLHVHDSPEDTTLAYRAVMLTDERLPPALSNMYARRGRVGANGLHLLRHHPRCSGGAAGERGSGPRGRR